MQLLERKIDTYLSTLIGERSKHSGDSFIEPPDLFLRTLFVPLYIVDLVTSEDDFAVKY